jgi:hypothetical protein
MSHGIQEREDSQIYITPPSSTVQALTLISFRGRDPDEAGLSIGFPQEDPSTFKTFITFLRTGELHHPNLRSNIASKHFFRFLTELFAFANDFEADTMRNAVLDRFFLRIYSQPNRLPMDNIRDVYKNTSENSSLRDLVITIIINIGTSGLVDDYSNEIPRQFLVDCLRTAAEDKIVPFSHKEQWQASAWLERKKDRICRHYHVHDEDQDEMSMSSRDGSDGDEAMDEDGDEHEVSARARHDLAFIDQIRAMQIRY